MEIDPSPISRKRRRPSAFANNTGDSDDDNEYEDSHNETPSKRLENTRGLPIPRQTYHLNTHLILQSLAVTRLHVTANFSQYNPHTSPVLICVTRQDDTLYRTLCTILPSLYRLSPTLQSLCIMSAEQLSTALWATHRRDLPILTAANLDEEAAHGVSTLLDEVVAVPDVIVLFDATGKSMWSSMELPSELQTGWDVVTTLRRELVRALRSLGTWDGQEDAMDMG